MTLVSVLAFEWRYQARQPLFAASAAALMALAAMLVATTFGPSSLTVTSPYVVMQSLGLLSLMAVFVLTLFTANAALRDSEHGMTELIFATPLSRRDWFLGRYLGAVLAAAIVMALATLILAVTPGLLAIDPARVGAVRPLAYLWAYVVLVLPNLILAGAVLFAVAALTRNTAATYVAGVALYAAYWMAAFLVDSPLMAGATPTAEGLARAALLDPFGLSAFFEATRYWTPVERETRLLPLAGHLLTNRLGVLALAGAILTLAYRRTTLTVAGGRLTRRTRPRREEAAPPAIRDIPQGAAPGAFRTAFAIARLELSSVLRSWPFIGLILLWIFLIVMEVGSELGSGEYGSRQLPSTQLLFDRIAEPLTLLGTLVVAYYAAEIVWRDRLRGFHHLADATPAGDGTRLTGRLLALLSLPLLLCLVAIGTGLAFQLAYGYPDIRLGAYMALLWFAGFPLVIMAVGAFFLQVVLPNRWLGTLAALLLAAVAIKGSAIGLVHPMSRYGAFPTVGYSELDGFGGIASSFAAFAAWWGAVACLLLLLARGLWRRGSDVALARRLRHLGRTLGAGGRRLAVASLLLTVGVGAWLAWSLGKHGGVLTSEEQAAWSAAYERTYRPMAGRPQPAVTRAIASVRLEPAGRRAEVVADLMLSNSTQDTLRDAWLATPRDAAVRELRIEGAHEAEADTAFAMTHVVFDLPMPPGGSRAMRWTVDLDRGGIRGRAPRRDVTGNGTMIASDDILPFFGYRPGLELDDAYLRTRHGLTAPPSRRREASAVGTSRTEGPWIALDLTIATASDQTALAPGRLVKEWEGDGQRWFRYVTDGPVTPAFMIVSARYAVLRLAGGDATIEVWYDPRHAVNVPRIAEAARASLATLGARWGAYEGGVLRIAEVPRWAGFGAFATPGLILFPEHRGFLADGADGPVDLVLRRVAHEVAHQWWGHRLDPEMAEGAVVLVETLAKDGEQQVVAAVDGDSSLIPLLAFDEDRYLVGRADAGDDEEPMVRLTDGSYLFYGKGAMMMHALRERLGNAQVDRALRWLIEERGGPLRTASVLDLRNRLLAEAPTAGDSAAVHEWFEARVTWDLRVDSARVLTREGTGSTLVFEVSGERLDGQAPAPAEDEVAVAVEDSAGRTLWRGQVPLEKGSAVDTLTIEGQPTTVVVDPSMRVIDRDRTNNRQPVKEPS